MNSSDCERKGRETMSLVELQSERLRFEPYTISDFYFVKSLLQDPRVMRFISPDGKPYSDEQTIEWFERQLARYETGRQTGLLKLMTHDKDEPIGHAGTLLQELDGSMELEVGYWLSPKHWHMGYGREAAARLMQYAFSQGEKEIISLIHPDNIPSQRVAKANGLHWDRDTEYEGMMVSVYAGDLERLCRHMIRQQMTR